jgi:hypothetical protein
MADAPGGVIIADNTTMKRTAAGVGDFRMGSQPPAARLNSLANDGVDDIAPVSFNGKAAFRRIGQAEDLPERETLGALVVLRGCRAPFRPEEVLQQ